MELTDSEKDEFTRLANATFDPGLCSAEDLPWLRAARADYKREQAKERGEVIALATENERHDDECTANNLNGIMPPELPPAMAEPLNERADEIVSLWSAHQNAKNTAEATKEELRTIRLKLGEQLWRLKQVLACPGRDGQWSAFLREHKIPRASADRLVQRHMQLINPPANCINEADSEPTDNEIQILFKSISPRLQRTLRTPASVYSFIALLISSYKCGEFTDRGILVPKPIPATTCTASSDGNPIFKPEFSAAPVASAGEQHG
jgi:hypothetical protein